MTRFEERVSAGRRTGVFVDGELNPAERSLQGPAIPPGNRDRVELAIGDLAEILVAVLRRHPHIGNVSHHICDGRWAEIDQVLRIILDPRSTCDEMSPLAENVLELLWAERGTTGRILKPYFRGVLNKLLPTEAASRVCAHVSSLSLEMEALRYTPREQRADDPADHKATTTAGGGNV